MPQEEQQKKYKKVMPESDLELNYMFTKPQWGDDSVSPDLKDAFQKQVRSKIPKGEWFKTTDGYQHKSDGTIERVDYEKNMWSFLSMLTQDIRLANYSGPEYNYCAYMYETGGMMLNENFKEASAIAILLGAIRGEMSQGKSGFLRKQMNTLIQDTRYSGLDDQRKSILSKGKPKQQQ